MYNIYLFIYTSNWLYAKSLHKIIKYLIFDRIPLPPPLFYLYIKGGRVRIEILKQVKIFSIIKNYQQVIKTKASLYQVFFFNSLLLPFFPPSMAPAFFFFLHMQKRQYGSYQGWPRVMRKGNLAKQILTFLYFYHKRK